jgi:pimeloyl-ACP methyl ester carboxylesterase
MRASGWVRRWLLPRGVRPSAWWQDVADTRYVPVGGADVAYKVVGDGPLDLLYFYGLGSQVDLYFADPRVGPWIDGLASFSRLICFDRRGTGASDRVAAGTLLTWEDRQRGVAALEPDRAV